MKTNKSYTKRLKVTKTGKILARTPGHNHFNAKRSGGERQRRRRWSTLKLNAVAKSRFLA
jgi:ribosomal protein L35